MAFGGFGKNSGPSLPPKTQTSFGNLPQSPYPPNPFNNNVPQRRSPSNSGSEAPQRVSSPPLDFGRKRSIDGFSYPSVEAWRPTVSPPRRADLPKSLVNDSNYQIHQRPSVAPHLASRNAGTSSLAKSANFQGLKRTRSPPFPNEVHLENSTQDVVGRGPVSPQRMHSPPLAFESYRPIEDLHDPSKGAQRLPTKLSNFLASKRIRPPPLTSTNEVLRRDSHPPQDEGDRSAISPLSLGNKSNLLANNANLQTRHRFSQFSPNVVTEDVGASSINSQVPNRTRSPPLPSTTDVFLGNSYSIQDDNEREMQAKAKRLARFNVELSQPMQSNPDLTKPKFPGNKYDQALVDRRKFVAEHEAAGNVMLLDYEGLESSSVIIGLCPDMCPESEREERERKGDLDKYERLDGDRNQTSKALAVKKYNRTAEREADLIRPMAVLQKTVDYLLALLDQPYDDRFLGMYNFLWDRMRAIRMDLRMQHIFNQDAITMLEQMIRLHIVAMHELCEYTKGEGFSEGFDAHLNIEQMNKASVELFQMYDDHRKKGSSVLSEREFRGYYALLKLDKHPGYKVEPAELSLDLAKMTPEIRQTPEILFAREVARACRTGNFIAFFRLARKATYLQACLMHAHFAKLRTQALASLHSGLQNNQGVPVAHVTTWIGMEEEDIESLLEYHGFLIKEFEEPYMVKDGPFLNGDKDYPTKCSQLVHLKKSRRIIEDVSSTDQVEWPTQEAKKVVTDKIDKLEPQSIQSVRTKTLVNAFDEEMIDFQDFAPLDDSQVQPVLEIPSAAGQKGGTDHQAVPWDIPSIHHPPQSTPAKVGRVGKPASEILRNDSLERSLRSNVKGMPVQSVTGRALQIERADGSYIESLVGNSASKGVVNKAQENDESGVACQEVEYEDSILIHQDAENEEDIMVHQENEAARAKLKLIIRIWKRHSSRRRELREQRQLASNVALSSLSLGPPIHHIKAQLSHVSELNIDRVVRERQKMHGRSWSRLNVSEVVGNALYERNTDAKCLCWKLLVCSPFSGTWNNVLGQRSHTIHLAGQWLLSKLMGVRMENDDELAVSSPGLSIWKKWVTRRYGSLPTCCLSVIRETQFNKLDDSVDGASAILFLASESIPWELQKIQLQNLLMSLPLGSCLPLLVLSDTSREEILDASSTIVNRLGLHHVDKTRISNFSVVFLVENHPPENLDGFFSSDRLREGLQWLASQSPLQPILRCVKTRELVMEHLNSLLEVLDQMNVHVVDPNHCISAFNKALDQLAEKVATAAETNPSSWPCPEIDLLRECSDECRVVESFLPTVGWSSGATIKPILNTIQGCKLPFFPDDLSWLNHGSDMGKEIKNQKSQLEKCLIRYLAHLTKMMDWALATTEAHAMLQKSARLELQGSEYHIVPRWVAIFRRVFNWRLMNLTSGIHSIAYVLECKEPCNIITPLKVGVREFNRGATSPNLEGLDNLWLEGNRSLSYALTQPSLDEMVEVFCSSQLSEMEQSEDEAIQPQSGTVDKGIEVLYAATASYDEDLRQEEGEFTNTSDAFLLGNYGSSRQVLVTKKGKKEADRLSKLLEECNILQNTIDEKLSIYF